MASRFQALLVFGTFAGIVLGMACQPDLSARPDDPFGGEWVCDVPVEAPQEIQSGFQSFYDAAVGYKQCVESEGEKWFAAFPAESAKWSGLWTSMVSYTNADLRGTYEASAWMAANPYVESSNKVQLDSAAIEAGKPMADSTTLGFPGIYNKFFIHGATNRMYLTSETAGLAAIDIKERFKFVELGRALGGSLGDVHVVNPKYAYVVGIAGSEAGDLIVMDVSDPANMVEVKRLSGVIASSASMSGFYADLSWSSTYSSPNLPPSFMAYVAVKQYRFDFGACASLKPIEPTNSLNIKCDEYGDCTGPRRFMTPPSNGTSCEKLSVKDYRDDTAQGQSNCTFCVQQMTFNPALEQSINSWAGAGVGGSSAASQIATYNNMLYILGTDPGVVNGFVNTFDITDPANPLPRSIVEVDNMPEAIVRYDNLLMVAGRAGMIDMSVAQPDQPKIVGDFMTTCPVRCEPIAVRGHYAYRTAGLDCNWNPGELQVFDISDATTPTLVNTIYMNEPIGLKVLGDFLYVADRAAGNVHIFNIADPVRPVEVGSLSAAEPKDVIIDGFDVYSLSDDEIKAFYVASLYESSIPTSGSGYSTYVSNVGNQAKIVVSLK